MFFKKNKPIVPPILAVPPGDAPESLDAETNKVPAYEYHPAPTSTATPEPTPKPKHPVIAYLDGLDVDKRQSETRRLFFEAVDSQDWELMPLLAARSDDPEASLQYASERIEANQLTEAARGFAELRADAPIDQGFLPHQQWQPGDE